MTKVLAQFPSAEFLIRTAATASIVVAAATAVGRLGPIAGGLLFAAVTVSSATLGDG